LAAALSAMPGIRLLTGPPRGPVRILDEITALDKGRDLGVIAETIVNSNAGSILCDYTENKIGPKLSSERILSTMLDLDGLVARSPLDKVTMVMMLNKLLGDVFEAAEDDPKIRERTVSVRKILHEYIPKKTLAWSGIDFDTE
jgi:hypothetical protein